MKVCKSCLETKALDEFHKNSSRKDGRMGVCKTCNSARMRKWHRENYHGDRKLTKQAGMHRLTLEEFNLLLASQGGTCAGCGEIPETFCIDHDHNCCAGRFSCGKCVRGLLCQGCNRALGGVKDNSETLKRLALYLGV